MQRNVHILLLEDDEDLREVLVEVFTDEGYRVTAVGSGEMAVEKAAHETYDLIIADIRMEGMGGLEAIKHAQELQPGIGSMVVSGYATERETAKAQRLNVGAYIKKPFKTQELLRHVRELLGQEGRKEIQAREDQVVWDAFDWSLHVMASAVDEARLYSGSLLKASEKALYLSERSGSSSEECRAVRRATLILGYCENSGVSVPDFFSQPNQQLGTLPLLVKEALSNSPPAERSPSTQAVLLALETEVGEASSVAALRQTYSAPLVDILEAMEPIKQVGKIGKNTKRGSRSSLILLAKTLERVGDTVNAGKAFRSLCDSSSNHKEKVEGYLGQARLQASQGEIQACRDSCLSALRLAKSLGPLTLSESGLQAALLLESIQADETDKALELVSRSLSGLGLVVQESLLQLAQRKLEGPSDVEKILAVLTQPAAYNELARYSDWLFPKLFAEIESGALTFSPLLIRLARDFPKDFMTCFASGKTSSSRRIAVGKALLNSRFLPELVLQGFKSALEPELRELAAHFEAKGAKDNPGNLLRLYSFGEFELLTQGQPLMDKDWKTRKVKFLFSYLARNWGKPISDELLLETFWPKDQTRTKNNLHWACTALRGLLRKLNPSLQNPVIRSHDCIGLDPEIPHWHDLEEFRKAAKVAKVQQESGHLQEARGYLRLAGRLYKGPYLEGCYYDFAVEERTQNEQLALDVYTDAARLALEAEDNDEALEHATSATEVAPYDQEATSLKMRSHMRLGQAPTAVEEFQRLETLLKADYGMEPATSLIELYHRARLGFGCS